MYKRQQKTVIALFVISVMAISLLREGYAAPTVIIRAIPNQTEVYVGAGEILFTAHVRGLKNVTYTWKLTGPGKFEGDTVRSAVFYIPPDKIDKQSVKVIVAVIVSDDTGQQVAASVPLTILAKPKSSPASTPTPEDTPKSGMSLVTKTALGLGAAAALGGGIILATGGGDIGGGDDSTTPTPTPTPSCTGVEVGGYCWHLGAKSQSCSDACASYGGYHETTRTYAGSEGTDSNCSLVLSALGVPQQFEEGITEHGYLGGIGCYYFVYWSGTIRRGRDYDPTVPDASRENFYRACACNW